MSSVVKNFSVTTSTIDGAFAQPETIWNYNLNWNKYLGYYRKIPELKAVINAKATWTIGKGFKADEQTELLLDTIDGWGKDTFNSILESMIRIYNVGGDAFAEIIRDKEGILLNLKPLDPEDMVLVANKQGLIKRYEQNSKTGLQPKKFKPEDIFHLSRNRFGDELHGQSIIEELEEIILMRNEAMADMRKLLHRNVFPIHEFHLDTDDPVEIAAFKAKADNAVGKGENMFIPKGAAEHTLQSVPANATLNPLPWIEALNNYFYEAANVPQIIVGGVGGLTEAAVKIAYLAFQQAIEEEQLFIEESILQQLNLFINLEFPASLENELLSDKAKDGAVNIQPSETTAGMGK